MFPVVLPFPFASRLLSLPVCLVMRWITIYLEMLAGVFTGNSRKYRSACSVINNYITQTRPRYVEFHSISADDFLDQLFVDPIAKLTRGNRAR